MLCISNFVYIPVSTESKVAIVTKFIVTKTQTQSKTGIKPGTIKNTS